MADNTFGRFVDPDKAETPWDFAGQIIQELFYGSVGQDEAKAEGAMLEFAKSLLEQSEHLELERIQREERDRFHRLIARMGEQHFDYLNEFLELLKKM